MRACLASAEQEPLGMGKVRVVRALPDMWADLANFLRVHSHHGKGEPPDTRRIAGMWTKLARRIERELGKLGNHPAYRNVAVLGIDRTVLSAWKTGDQCFVIALDAILYQEAHPAKAGVITHGLLIPQITIVRGRSVTQWRWRPTSGQTDAATPEAPPDPRAASPT